MAGTVSLVAEAQDVFHVEVRAPLHRHSATAALKRRWNARADVGRAKRLKRKAVRDEERQVQDAKLADRWRGIEPDEPDDEQNDGFLINLLDRIVGSEIGFVAIAVVLAVWAVILLALLVPYLLFLVLFVVESMLWVAVAGAGATAAGAFRRPWRSLSSMPAT